MDREVASNTVLDGTLDGTARTHVVTSAHAAARRGSGTIRRWLQSLLAMCLLLGAAMPAWAACGSPQTATVASGGQVGFECALLGFKIPSHLPPGDVPTHHADLPHLWAVSGGTDRTDSR